MVASRGDVLHDGQHAGAAQEQAHVAPSLALVEPVQVVACRDARFTTRAAVEIDFKGILLSGRRRRGGQ
jgi:hypothetical protein